MRARFAFSSSILYPASFKYYSSGLALRPRRLFSIGFVKALFKSSSSSVSMTSLKSISSSLELLLSPAMTCPLVIPPFRFRNSLALMILSLLLASLMSSSSIILNWVVVVALEEWACYSPEDFYCRSSKRLSMRSCFSSSKSFSYSFLLTRLWRADI